MTSIRLAPPGGKTWLDCASPDAPDGIRMLHAMLDAGLLEAWNDGEGRIRLRAPTA
jgi:hypothetical protein